LLSGILVDLENFRAAAVSLVGEPPPLDLDAAK
jgi:hypothetical protein